VIPFLSFGYAPKFKESKWKIQPQFDFKYGFLLPHSGAVKPLMGGTFPVYELGIELPNIGTAEFNKNHPYHKFGFIVNFSPLSNPDLLGYSFGILPYLDINIGSSSKNHLSFRLASGLAYIQKPFDIETNYKNVVIGSHLNNVTDFSLKYRFNITPEIETRIGLGIQHFSNGSFLRPNLGLNIPHASFGFKYGINEEKSPASKKYKSDSSRFYTALNYGSKTLIYGSTTSYSVYNLAFGYSLALNKNRYFHFQLDFIYDFSIPHLKVYDYQLKATDSWILGPFVWYEKRYGNIGLAFGSGYYIHSVYKTFDQDWSFKNKGGRFYNRGSLKVYFKHFYSSLSIKAHAGEADNLEIGIGYRFK
jgi:hypothetical protein